MAIDLRTVLSPVIVGDACSPAVTLQVSFSWGSEVGVAAQSGHASQRKI